MIVSHQRKFIFLKTRKTAGTSLEIALSAICGPDDILTPIDFDEQMRLELTGKRPQNHAMPLHRHNPGQLFRYLRSGERVPVYTEHMTAVDARKRLGETVWNSYFKFTVVRDPFDRMLSRYFWAMKARPRHREDWGIETLDQFLRYRAEYVNENWLIYTRGDRLVVDDAVRFEHLEADLARISERIGLEHNIHDDMKSIRAKSDFRPDSSTREAQGNAIGPAQAEIIRRLCVKEIEAFDYSDRTASVPEPVA